MRTRTVLTTESYRLFGSDGLSAAAVTSRLGVEPTASYEAGERLSASSTGIRDASLWLLTSSPGIESDVELDTQLVRLLDRLEPAAEALWELVKLGYEANWLGLVASNTCEHAVELDRGLLRRVLALPGALWLDVCGDD